MDRTADVRPPYRYRLSRTWQSGPRLAVVMLNPSVADALRDDPTITRLIHRAQELGFGTLDVVNLFAWRATNPNDLWAARNAGFDIVGPDNAATIHAAMSGAREVVLAWGNLPKGVRVDALAVEAVYASGKIPFCLGLTKRDYPKHPLYQSFATPLIAYQGRFSHAAGRL